MSQQTGGSDIELANTNSTAAEGPPSNNTITTVRLCVVFQRLNGVAHFYCIEVSREDSGKQVMEKIKQKYLAETRTLSLIRRVSDITVAATKVKPVVPDLEAQPLDGVEVDIEGYEPNSRLRSGFLDPGKLESIGNFENFTHIHHSEWPTDSTSANLRDGMNALLIKAVWCRKMLLWIIFFVFVVLGVVAGIITGIETGNVQDGIAVGAGVFTLIPVLEGVALHITL